MTAIPRLVLLLVCALGSACSTLPGGTATTHAFAADQKRSARELQDEGRLAEALVKWETLLPLRPADAETAAAIRSLEAKIKTQVDGHLLSARAAYGRGQTRDGDTLMLKVLALSPGHIEALNKLSRSQSARARAQQAGKSSEEYKLAVAERAKPAASAVSGSLRLQQLFDKKEYAAVIALGSSLDSRVDTKVPPLMRASHIELANAAEKNGQLDVALEHIGHGMALQPVANDPLVERTAALSRGLSHDWYQRGVHLMKNDLPQAIAALEKSLSYNPYNNDARIKLAQVQTLQRNLQKIEGGR